MCTEGKVATRRYCFYRTNAGSVIVNSERCLAEKDRERSAREKAMIQALAPAMAEAEAEAAIEELVVGQVEASPSRRSLGPLRSPSWRSSRPGPIGGRGGPGLGQGLLVAQKPLSGSMLQSAWL